jgi:hypothetical protein
MFWGKGWSSSVGTLEFLGIRKTRSLNNTFKPDLLQNFLQDAECLTQNETVRGLVSQNL